MATVTDRGVVRTVGRGRSGAASPSRLPTTLYDLIAAIQDVAGPDDELVVATVRHLLRSRRLIRRGSRRGAQRVMSGASRLGRSLRPPTTAGYAGASGQPCGIP
jgi:hypothetical protein